MAFIFRPEEEEKDENGVPKNNTGFMAKPGTGNNQVSGAPTSSGFVNLQKYLDVNREKSAGMADKVVDQTTGSDTNLNTLNTDFGKKIDDYKTQTSDLETSNNIIKNYDTSDGGLAAENEEVTAANDLQGDDLINYQGPTERATKQKGSYAQLDSLVNDNRGYTSKLKQTGQDFTTLAGKYASADGSDAYTKAKTAQTLTGDNLDGMSARAQALKNIYGKSGNYSSGMNALDSALTNNVGADKFKTVNTSVGSAVTAADTVLGRAKTEVTDMNLAGKANAALGVDLTGDITAKKEAIAANDAVAGSIDEKYKKLREKIQLQKEWNARHRNTPNERTETGAIQ